jgi:GNAT superfamily N-acetyltransferase
MSEVTIYYLEMNSINELNPKHESKGLTIREVEIKNFRLNRFLYQYVGEPWQWTDKLSHTDESWKAYAESPMVSTFVAYYRGAIAGYFELQNTASGDVEIMYFGLAEDFISKGFGGYLLTCAIKSAWSLPDVKRVWLHTCSLDHLSALQNYKARGFKIYKEEVEQA